jgi:predicted CopG family antitoxin
MEEDIKMRKKHYTKNVGVLLSDETYALLIEATDKAEVTFSNFIRKLIEDKLRKIIDKGE